MESSYRIAKIEQIEALLDFVEKFPDLADSNFSRTIEGRTTSRRLWSQCGKILNTVTADCPSKSPREWRIFFNDYKRKLLSKIKGKMCQTSDTGQLKKIELSPLQMRLYEIMKLNTSKPSAEVLHNSLFDETSDSKSQDEEPQDDPIQSPNSLNEEYSQQHLRITPQSHDAPYSKSLNRSLHKRKRIKTNEREIKSWEMRASTSDTTENEISYCDLTSPIMDTDQMYANFLAGKFRSYSKRTRNHLQHEISNLLFQADNGFFDTNNELHDGNPQNSMGNRTGDSMQRATSINRSQWPSSPSSHQYTRSDPSDPLDEDSCIKLN